MKNHPVRRWGLSPARRLARLRESAQPCSYVELSREVVARLCELRGISKQNRKEFEGDPRDPDFPTRWYDAETASRAGGRLPEWISEVTRGSPDSRIRKDALDFLVERDAAPRRAVSEGRVPTVAEVEEAWERASLTHPAGEAARQLLTGEPKMGSLAPWLRAVSAMLRRGEDLPVEDSLALAGVIDSGAFPAESASHHQMMVEEYIVIRGKAMKLYVSELRGLQKAAGLPAHIDGDFIPTPEEMADSRRGKTIKIRAPHLLWMDSVVASAEFKDYRAARAYLNRREAHYVAEFRR